MQVLRAESGFSQFRRHAASKLAATLLALVAALASPCMIAPTQANGRDVGTQIKVGDPGVVGQVRLTVNKSQTLRLNQSFSEALIASPRIADVVPLTDKSVYIVGKEVGLTHLTVLDPDKKLIAVIEVEVSYDVQGLREELRRSVPGGQFQVRTANGRIVLAGMVPDAIALARAVSITEQFTADCEAAQPHDLPNTVGAGAPTNAVAGVMAPAARGASAPAALASPAVAKHGPAARCFVNMLSVRAPQQVLLEVRFVEAQRSAARDLGFNWSVNGARFSMLTGIGGFPSSNVPFGSFVARILDNGTTADVLIRALEERGIARRLAEPNLVTLSGDTANFLAGGEFPFPVAAERDRITIEFKKFGVGLAFTPTVLAEGQINLKIEPEVSDLDPNNTILVANTQIPSLIVRRASTTVELRDGQSFAIAGLLQTKHTKSTRELPWISTVPVLGTLFRSASYEKNDSDLVIIVTPRLVQPAKPGKPLATPLDQRLAANDRDYFLGGQLEVPKDFTGPHGHILNLTTQPIPSKPKEAGDAPTK